VQERLAQFDLLNQWTTPVGSATFAIARGVKPGEILAEELFA
jgi:dye decolorizing peroxidase